MTTRGMVVLDVADMTRPRQVGHAQWGGGSTHTCLPLPGRGLVVATDEQVHDGPHAPRRSIRVLDVSGASPRVLAECPHPAGFGGLPLRFGAHNLHENQPGSYTSERILFATYFSAGVRVYDLADPGAPRRGGALDPRAAARPAGAPRSTTCSWTPAAWSGSPTGSAAACTSWSPSRPWPPSWPRPEADLTGSQS